MSRSEGEGFRFLESEFALILLGLLFPVTVRHKFHLLTAGPFFLGIPEVEDSVTLGPIKRTYTTTMAKDQKKAAKKVPLVKKIAATALRSHVGERARYVVKTAQTLAPEIVFSFCCRKNEEASSAYIKPLLDHFNSELENGNNDIARE